MNWANLSDRQREIIQELVSAFKIVLDDVDYLAGNCKVNQQVRAVLAPFAITNARAAIKEVESI